MSTSLTLTGALAAALLVASAGTAAAQSADDLSMGSIDASSVSGPGSAESGSTGTESGTSGAEGNYLGSAGEMLPGSVTGSLPGYASGPMGSAATAVCNVGSAAGLAGMGLPGSVDPVCKVLPAAGESGDLFMQGDYTGSVSALIGAVPFVGGSLERVVPTGSAADAVEGSVGAAPTDSLGGLVPGS